VEHHQTGWQRPHPDQPVPQPRGAVAPAIEQQFGIVEQRRTPNFDGFTKRPMAKHAGDESLDTFSFALEK